MIRVNLAVRSQAVIDATRLTAIAADNTDAVDQQDIQKQGLYRLLVVLIGPLALLGYERIVIPQKKSELRSHQVRLSEYEQKNNAAKSAVEETKKFKDDETRLQNQIQTIESLRKERLNEVKILSAIQQQIPEKLWLSRVELKGEVLNLQGVSATDAEITAFMDSLSQHGLIASVDLIKSTEQQSGSLIVKRFEIRCGVKATVAEEKPK